MVYCFRVNQNQVGWTECLIAAAFYCLIGFNLAIKTACSMDSTTTTMEPHYGVIIWSYTMATLQCGPLQAGARCCRIWKRCVENRNLRSCSSLCIEACKWIAALSAQWPDEIPRKSPLFWKKIAFWNLAGTALEASKCALQIRAKSLAFHERHCSSTSSERLSFKILCCYLFQSVFWNILQLI